MAEQQQTGRPWTKNGPSPNPRGRGGKRPPPGSDGIVAPGGYLFTGETDPKLMSPTKWVTYDNLLTLVPIVAATVRIWLDLGGSVKWSLQDNPSNTTDAKRCTELVQEGLLTARMSKPLPRVFKRQLMSGFRGVAMHAKGTIRDPQGRIVFSDLAHRPAWTVNQWIKPLETEPWTAIVQRTRLGSNYRIERDELFYSVDDAFGSDQPEGIGRFRSLVESERIWTRFRQLLGIAFDTDVNGVPLVRAPLAQLAQEAVSVGECDPKDGAAIAAYVQARVQPLIDFAKKRVTTPDRHILLDSTTYTALDVDGSEKPSDVPLWNIETIKSMLASLPELRKALDDLNREIARVICAEWMLMGDSEGARAVHIDKTNMFGLAVNSSLDDLTADAQSDLVDWIVAKNGFDVRTCAPKLVHEPVATQSSLEAAQTLAELAKAGIDQTGSIYKRFLERLDLPADELIEPAPKQKAKQDPAPEPGAD